MYNSAIRVLYRRGYNLVVTGGTLVVTGGGPSADNPARIRNSCHVFPS